MKPPASTGKSIRGPAVVNVPPARAFAPIRQIGGRAGWYYGNLLWKARGRIDRWMGGIGMDGLRQDPHHCAVGDVIDGWTVDAYEPDGRMRLLAGMKLPGRGWLEFEVTPLDGGRHSQIRQTARFDPRGVLGRAYWYAVLPFHAVIFRGLLRRLAQLAEHGDQRHASGRVRSSIGGARTGRRAVPLARAAGGPGCTSCRQATGFASSIVKAASATAGA